MNLFSALCESIRRVFGSKNEPAPVPTQPSEPIPHITIAPTASAVTASDATLVIEKGAYRPSVSGPATPPPAEPVTPKVTPSVATEAAKTADVPSKPAKKAAARKPKASVAEAAPKARPVRSKRPKTQ